MTAVHTTDVDKFIPRPDRPENFVDISEISLSFDSSESSNEKNIAIKVELPPYIRESQIPPSELNQETLFRELVAQHQKRLYRFVIKYIDHPDDAADITQQAFVEAARTIASFRGDSKLSTWLFGIAMNMVRNYLSRAPHRIWKFETDDSLTTVASNWPDPSDCLIQKEMLELAEKAFSDLSEEMSEVLGLVAVDEISYQDAADILGIPLGTVRSRVSRARAVLRAHFADAGVIMKF